MMMKRSMITSVKLSRPIKPSTCSTNMKGQADLKPEDNCSCENVAVCVLFCCYFMQGPITVFTVKHSQSSNNDLKQKRQDNHKYRTVKILTNTVEKQTVTLCPSYTDMRRKRRTSKGRGRHRCGGICSLLCVSTLISIHEFLKKSFDVMSMECGGQRGCFVRSDQICQVRLSDLAWLQVSEGA